MGVELPRLASRCCDHLVGELWRRVVRMTVRRPTSNPCNGLEWCDAQDGGCQFNVDPACWLPEGATCAPSKVCAYVPVEQNGETSREARCVEAYAAMASPPWWTARSATGTICWASPATWWT